MKILIGALVIFGISTFPGRACMCDNDTPFIEIVGSEDVLVIRGTVASYTDYREHPMADKVLARLETDRAYGRDTDELVSAIEGLAPRPNSMIVVIEDIYSGEYGSRIIKIWGDDGAKCRPYVTHFNKGEQYVFAVSVNNNEIDEAYYISNCGEYWLKREGDVFIGDVDGPIGYQSSILDEGFFQTIDSNKSIHSTELRRCAPSLRE